MYKCSKQGGDNKKARQKPKQHHNQTISNNNKELEDLDLNRMIQPKDRWSNNNKELEGRWGGWVFLGIMLLRVTTTKNWKSRASGPPPGRRPRRNNNKELEVRRGGHATVMVLTSNNNKELEVGLQLSAHWPTVSLSPLRNNNKELEGVWWHAWLLVRCVLLLLCNNNKELEVHHHIYSWPRLRRAS